MNEPPPCYSVPPHKMSTIEAIKLQIALAEKAMSNAEKHHDAVERELMKAKDAKIKALYHLGGLKEELHMAEERRKQMALNREKVLEEKLTTPLTAETDALKLKELTKRFPFADFHVTDHKLGLYYRVEFNNGGLDWMPEMLWYKNQASWFEERDNGTPFFYFPRPFKLEITTGGFKKDVTHLFN